VTIIHTLFSRFHCVLKVEKSVKVQCILSIHKEELKLYWQIFHECLQDGFKAVNDEVFGEINEVCGILGLELR
jgi:hypothetical protein